MGARRTAVAVVLLVTDEGEGGVVRQVVPVEPRS
jgi:hypothetical protein